MADRFVVDAAVAALLPLEDAVRLGGDFLSDSTKEGIRSELQRQCDAFNSANPIGQKVNVRKDDGSHICTWVRHPAEVLSGHTAVIWLFGIRGCYLLDRVTPIGADRGRCA